MISYLCILLMTSLKVTLAEKLFFSHDDIVYAMYQNIIIDPYNETTHVKYVKNRSKSRYEYYFTYKKINTFMLFWPILGQRKTNLVVFNEKKERVELSFWPILFLMVYIRPLEIILWLKTQLNSLSLFINRQLS